MAKTARRQLEIRSVVSGPITYSPDAIPLVGPDARVPNMWLALGTGYGNLVPRAFPSTHFLRKKPWGPGWGHGIGLAGRFIQTLIITTSKSCCIK